VQYTDSNDTPVEGISGLLRVVADNKNVEGISVTENRADDKACLMLVIDSSGSIPAEDLPNIVSAVQALNDVRKRGDLYGIVTFGGADEIQNYGLQQDIIDTGVINRNGGSTAIWDAMQVGLGEMVQNCDTNITKRYLVLVTDGKDNSSKFGKGEEKSAIVASLHSQAVLDQTSVCVIGVSKDVEEESANLEQLVNDCDYSYIDNFKNLAEQFKQIMGYERAYYRIVIPQSALPNNADDVRVRITDTNVKIKVTFSPAP
jgi:Mg-chelatase subunit ChlD